MNTPMDDKTRILLTLIRELASTQILAFGSKSYDPETYQRRPNGDPTDVYTHFASYRHHAIQRGDLVLCDTSGIHDFTVGWAVRELGGGDWEIRELGSERLCAITNESFTPIVGLSKETLYEGPRRLFLEKVFKAFAKGNEYMYRYGGLDFDGPTARIWIREAFGGWGPAGESQPFAVDITPWSARMSITAILRAMRAGGYGTRKFERPGEARSIAEHITNEQQNGNQLKY